MQTHIKQQHTWKLADLKHQQKQITNDRNFISRTLDQHQLGGERLLEFLGKRLSIVNQKEQLIDGARLHHQEQQQEQYRRLKMIEKALDNANSSYRYELQGKELFELIGLALLKK